MPPSPHWEARPPDSLRKGRSVGSGTRFASVGGKGSLLFWGMGSWYGSVAAGSDRPSSGFGSTGNANG
ncbi:hypothetical protein H6F88_15695 [Oculatella sp. FACHB-28]|nr:hypothetical protein [Oculatella sp. FACHB-28]